MTLTMRASSLRRQHGIPSSPLLTITLLFVVLLQLTFTSVTSAAPTEERALKSASKQASPTGLASEVAPRVRRDLDEKRGKMAAWGKRESGDVEDGDLVEKRGKMAAWGKRESSDDEDGGASETGAPGELGNDELQAGDLDKRGKMAAWGDKRGKMAAWGEKRGKMAAWGEKRGKMAAWGKKRVAGNVPQFAANKATRSKWSDGNMSVWGKRSATGNDVFEDDDDEEEDEEKRSKWNDGNLSVWGKREDDIRRGWQNKGNLAVWG